MCVRDFLFSVFYRSSFAAIISHNHECSLWMCECRKKIEMNSESEKKQTEKMPLI